MDDTVVEALILDLLEWVATGERSYEEVMDAWRTSCPRLPVWEDANDRGLVMREEVNGRSIVKITSSGLTLLEQRKLLNQLLREERARERNGIARPWFNKPFSRPMLFLAGSGMVAATIAALMHMH